MSKFTNDLTKDSVIKQLILFSLPVLLSNVVQSFYSVADMIIVGRFAGTVSMSGVNIGSQVTFLITNMVFGLTVGATVLVGQYMGAGNKKALKETINTLFTTLVFLAVIITVVMIAVQTPLLKVIKTPEESFSEAKEYFFVTMLGTIFIFIYNALSSVMRGMGDSKHPLYFVTIACVVNVILDLLLVGAFGMKALGAAIATVVSQAISSLLCIIYLKRNDFVFSFKPKEMKIHKDRLKAIVKVGLPNCIQNGATSISFLFITALVNTFGVVASAAVGAVGKFNGFAILPAAAMSAAISAMVAQNIGAGEYKRARQILFYGTGIAYIFSIVIFALAQIFPEEILMIFDDDPTLLVSGAEYMRSFSYDYLIVPLVFCLNGLYIGSGHTTFSLINGMMSSVLIRIPASYVFGMVMSMGLFGVGLGAPVASGAALLVSLVFFALGKWKKQVIKLHDVDNADAALIGE
ncbi:MAG: MATE family efflux transporter [Clostridiales bacterium]|nr:MATE family efflux transporter [Clostridiales bacterium]